jgi:hypothetical protein
MTHWQNASWWPWACLHAPTSAAVAAAADADDLRRHSDAICGQAHGHAACWMWPSRVLDACWFPLLVARRCKS